MRYFVVFRQTDDAWRVHEDDRVEVDHTTYQRLFKDAWENEKAGAPMTPQPLQKESLEALDELYNFVDGLDPDFIIRERISIIKSRIQDTRSRPHTPAPEPDEKCEICGNPLEYHNNAYRWCKNMHSFRYFQTPHTSTPAPEPLEKFVLHLVHINQKLDETKRILKTYQRGDLTTEEEDDASELRGFRDALEWALIPDSKTTLAEHDAQVAKAERDREQPFIDFAKSASLKHSEMVDLMRRNNLKIDDLEDPMQKLAFTFFSEIGEMSHEAEVIIDESLRSQQEPQQ